MAPHKRAVGSGAAAPAATTTAARAASAPGGISPHSQIAEIQRTRLLAAACRAVEELGYPNTTVAHITRRARVSRRTFYELFANREECLAAILEDLLGQMRAELATLGLERLPWCERVRAGLWAILSFFDREPRLARVCVLHAAHGGPGVLECREQILGALAAVIDQGRLEGTRGTALTPLTAEGLVGAALTIVHARLLRRERRPLTDLQGELMGLIVLPYLGAAGARREQTRPGPARAPVAPKETRAARIASDPLDGLAMRLTYRTARVLECLQQHPGASNRIVAQHAGIADQGQVSKLLARLERIGLLANAGPGHLKGEPNVWTLTVRGGQVAQNVRMYSSREERAA